MAPTDDMRTARVIERLDSVIPELQALLDDLRETVTRRNDEQGGVYPQEVDDDEPRY